jgi:hypothetical protein
MSIENPLIHSSHTQSQVANIQPPAHQISDPSPDFIKSLECKGTQKAIEVLNAPLSDNEAMRSTFSIIQSGNQEFFEKTGRNMCYSELRDLYG